MELKLKHIDFDIEINNEPNYSLGSSDNNFQYDCVFHDEEAQKYQGSKRSIKIFKNGQLSKSAIVCAVGGSTGISNNSAVVWNNKIFICCANKVFGISLPDLNLDSITEVDMATCFGIYQADNGLFTHGELQITRLDIKGKIIWQTGLRDIIVYIEEDKVQDEFVMQDDSISLMDFEGNKYQIGFDGKFISEQLSEQQKRWDLFDKQTNDKLKKSWWSF